MITTACKNGLEIFTDNELMEIKSDQDFITATCKNGIFKGKKMAICLGGEVEKFADVSPNVVLNAESTSRVLMHEIASAHSSAPRVVRTTFLK